MNLVKNIIKFQNYNFFNFYRKSSFKKYNFISNDNFDFDFYLNNIQQLVKNVHLRRSKFLINLLDLKSNDDQNLKKIVQSNIDIFPNSLHSKWSNLNIEEAKKFTKEDFVLEEKHLKKKFKFKPKTAEEIFLKSKYLYLGHSGNLGNLAGNRCYMMIDDLCDLKNALINFTLNKLIKKYKFNLVNVPNLVFKETVYGCGFNICGDRNLVYVLKANSKDIVSNNEDQVNNNLNDINDICLSGTSEIPLAAIHLGETFDKSDLPLKLCTVSRCYRKEVSPLKVENGIYRVHYFDKIEMFALTTKYDSENILHEFLNIQKDILDDLELPYKILDMPPHELGSPAHRKFDIECWFPGRQIYGEVSSTSNCTDFQSRRFNIKYKYLSLDYIKNEVFNYDFVHTVNGTACAIPRILIAIAENHQTKNSIQIPEKLKPFLNSENIFQNKFNILDKKK